MKTVIVTGSAGLVGSEAVRQFAALGYRVEGIDNDGRYEFFGIDGSIHRNHAGLLSIRGYVPHCVDIRRESSIAAVFNEIDPTQVVAVIHAAAQPSHDWASDNPAADFDVNARGTLNILEATRRHAPHAAFVHCSTNKVYGDWPNHIGYDWNGDRLIPNSECWKHGFDESLPVDHVTHSLFGCSKLAADVYVQEYGRYFGMNTVCFRGGCLTGPGHAGVEQHGFLSYLCKCAVTGTPYKVIGYGGKQVRDNIHASDLVRAFVEYVNAPTPGAVYNIGGGPERSCSVLEAVAMAERLSGRKMTLEHVAEPRKGDHKWWITDTRKFEAAYPNWRQEYTLERTFEEIIEAQRERCAA